MPISAHRLPFFKNIYFFLKAFIFANEQPFCNTSNNYKSKSEIKNRDWLSQGTGSPDNKFSTRVFIIKPVLL
jgi:hypothetical protein